MEVTNNWGMFLQTLVLVTVLGLFLELMALVLPRWILGTKRKRKFRKLRSIILRVYRLLALVILLIALVSINYIVHGGLLLIALLFAYPFISSYLSGLSIQTNPLIAIGSKIRTAQMTGEVLRFLPFGMVVTGKNGERYINYKDFEKQGFEVMESQGNTARNTIEFTTSESQERIHDILFETPLLLPNQLFKLSKGDQSGHWQLNFTLEQGATVKQFEEYLKQHHINIQNNSNN